MKTKNNIMNWNQGACGLYSDYKGYAIIKQDHPMLLKFEIAKENEDKELMHVSEANTVYDCKILIDDLVKQKQLPSYLS